MISSSELIDLIKRFSITERLMIAEEILKDIREERTLQQVPKERAEPAILSLAGVMDEEEAQVFITAVNESRKIDINEW